MEQIGILYNKINKIMRSFLKNIFIKILKNNNFAYCGFNCNKCIIAKNTKKIFFNKKNNFIYINKSFHIKSDLFKNKIIMNNKILKIDKNLNGKLCLGCKSNFLYYFCKDCNIRVCCFNKNLVDCSYCKNYPCKNYSYKNFNKIYYFKLIIKNKFLSVLKKIK
jgi:hypothetical protein